MRTLTDWLTHLEALNAERLRHPFFQERTQRFKTLVEIGESLQILSKTCPVVIVGGTNGKGSCVALLAAVFCAAGYRVGSFTSPHLLRYNERIQINQQPVDDKDLLEAFEQVEVARQNKLLGYFEFTTLAGLWLFKKANLDITILEVGMGGRLDPVNMIDAEVSIISSVDLDHTHILGDSLESIAFEKAGIMRPEKPCVWGDSPLFENIKLYAKELGAKLFLYGQDFLVKKKSSLNLSSTTWSWLSGQKCLENLPRSRVTHLPNAACALQAVELLQPLLPVGSDAIEEALREVVVPGRFQTLVSRVKTILDIAHNPASAQLLRKNLQASMITGKILLVVAILKTKDIAGTLAPLVDLSDRWYLGEFQLEQCAPSSVVAECLKSLSVEGCSAFHSVEEAYRAAMHDALPNDVIVVTGSTHAVAAILLLHR